jgi:hypothetical protein
MAAPTSMKISITQSDIDMGERHHSRFCPVSLAASRAFRRDIRVSWTRAWGNPHIEPAICFALPEKVKDFVLSFDRGDQVEPFEFDIEGV